MHSPRHFVRSLLLTGIMLGLSVMGVVRLHHAHVASHLASSHHPVPVQQQTRRSPNSGRRSGDNSASASGHAEFGSYHHIGSGGGPAIASALPVSAPALRFDAPLHSHPLATRNVVAVGSAPRAPGDPRGPPQLA
ncbi:MAG: hypothetical protein PW792_01160 [Acidobacteriaceae bacterium]|nr:hypothetical protein [Acidobacteriaceae bacterium]